jgi:DNA-binding transcriptional MerR regulator
MTRKRSYQVKEVAQIAGVSVRTLHHYDEIGLMTPRDRTDAGYRLYDDDDLLRLVLNAPSDQKEANVMDLKQIFDGFEPKQYEAEAEQRWGDTDAYKESMKRTKRYSKEDWQRCAAEQNEVYSDAFELKQAGKAPDGPEAMAVAERHRLAIDRWFYPCSYTMHVGLADMYEQDSRFAENIDKHGPGLTPFLSAAIRANANRHG